MTSTPFLTGTDIYLRCLTEKDCEGQYPTWFNDYEVCKENSHHVFPYTAADARAYIQHVNSTREKLVLAIVHSKDNKHIGNIALSSINMINRSAELTIVIGDKTYWAKGYGKAAARLICDHGFLTLNLNRIACGVFETNTAMQKLAEHLGMVKEGIRRNAVYKSGQYLNIIEYGVLREEYFKRFDISNNKKNTK